ncbi:MAG: hypothetical protein JJT96_04100 [Opitutales bacterium]|nr:hypothetical protein [Opitutales bacterium]
MTDYTESLNESLQLLLEPPLLFYAIGLLVAFILILYAVSRYRRACRGIEPFKSNGGRVEIAPATVKMLIVHVVGDINGVEWVGCRLRHGRKLVVSLALHVRAVTPLREIETETKRKVRYALKHQFGIDQVDAVHIRVTKVIGSPPIIEEEPEPEPVRLRKPEPREDPFTAPPPEEPPVETPPTERFAEQDKPPPPPGRPV